MSAIANIKEVREEKNDNIGGKIPEKFIVNLKGKSFVQYEGLLELAHQKGLQSLRTDLVQMPTAENGYLALMKATLIGSDGTVFEDYGDASPKSVTSMIVPHIIRMASTRAKARIMRDFTNVGMTAIEELGDDNSPLIQGDSVELLTDKQKELLRDNYDKVSSLFASIEDIAALPKDRATEIIGKYIFNNKSSDKGNKDNTQTSNKGNQGKNQNTNTKSEKANEPNSTNVKQQSNKEDKSQNAPANNPATTSTVENTQNGSTEEKATRGQISYVGILTKQLAPKQGKKQDELEAELKKEFNVGDLSDISKDAITSLIDKLKKQLTVA